MDNTVMAQKSFPGDKMLLLVQGDITLEAVDAIVNAANSRLQHGGGVAGVIVRKGGKIIQDESDRIGFVAVGTAAMTSAGKLPARHVIHAVGPRWGEGDEDAKLAGAVRSSLELAARESFTSISIPAISSGIFGFPRDRCARVILATVGDFLATHSEGPLQLVRICLFDDAMTKAFREAFG